MKKLGNYFLLTKKELNKKELTAYHDGQTKSKSDCRNKIKNLEDKLDSKTEDMRQLERTNKKLKAENSILQDSATEERKIAKEKIANEDTKAILEAKENSLDTRENALEEKEEELNSVESSQYKKGYADGVADGVRKINEITKEDRDNAMKVAMVAASSHTPVDNLKELNNVHQLTEGNKNREDK